MRTFVAVAALLAALILPTGAQALGVTVDRAAPADTAAGANSDFTLSIGFTGGTPKDLVIELPPGLLGDPNAAPRCAVATFTAGGCPANTALGTASASVVASGLLPVDAAGTVFNLQPTGPEPARLGIALKPSVGDPLYSQSPVSVRPDGGLTSTVTGLPNTASGLPIELRSLSLVLKGKTAAGGAFMRNPTSCGPATTTVRATPYAGAPGSATAAFTPTACDALPFDPKLTAVLGGKGQTGPAGKPGLSTTVSQAAGEAGAKSISVTLPSGIGTQLAALQRSCAQEALAAGTCPAESEIGTASATVPVLTQPLAGKVRLVRVDDGLPVVEVELKGQITQILRGVVGISPAGIVTTFDAIPDVPISKFTLNFNAGDSGLLLSQRDLCATNPPLSGTAVSQGGVSRALTATPEVDGCGKATTRKRTRAAVRLSRVGGTRGRAVKLRIATRGVGAKLRRVTVTLPKALRLSPRRVRAARPKGSSLRVRSSRTLRVTLPAKGARRATVVVRRGLRASPALRRAAKRKRLAFRVAATYVGGGSGKTTVRVRSRR